MERHKTTRAKEKSEAPSRSGDTQRTAPNRPGLQDVTVGCMLRRVRGDVAVFSPHGILAARVLYTRAVCRFGASKFPSLILSLTHSPSSSPDSAVFRFFSRNASTSALIAKTPLD
jgi:hypothetical protein